MSFKPVKLNKRGILLLAMCCLSVGAVFSYGQVFPHFDTQVRDEKSIDEGPVTAVSITAGPFDLHRKYRSMEGPYVGRVISVGDMIASKNITFPEGMVTFVEDRTSPKPASKSGAMSALRNDAKDTMAQGIVKADPKPVLWWFKGCKLEVLDENDKVLPTAEFICHWNLDVDPKFRNKVFQTGHPCVNDRLASISQGETKQFFPKGFAVPCSSAEPFDVSFQAANRTSNEHRRVKHRATFYFIKDRDLVNPVQSLFWYVPYETVVVDNNLPDLTAEQRELCNKCVGVSYGVDAPNDVTGGVWTDDKGRRLSGHWVVPPGLHTYNDLVSEKRDQGFLDPAYAPWILQAAWAHVHPLATKLSLIEIDHTARRPIYSANCVTSTNPGLQIMHLDYLSSEKGIEFPVGKDIHYEMEVTYNNTTSQALDSMASYGLYFRDTKFQRPAWSRAEFEGKFCGISPNGTTCSMDSSVQPVAEVKVGDVPELKGGDLPKLLTAPTNATINTNAGPLDIVLEPALAPKTATYMNRLFASNTLNGTRLFEYQPGYFIGFARPDDKLPGYGSIAEKDAALLRRLPLEVAPGRKHDKLMLSMSRENEDTNSGFGAFCIMLGKAPQLDGKYCIFGHVADNARSQKTLDKIEKNWDDHRYCVETRKKAP